MTRTYLQMEAVRRPGAEASSLMEVVHYPAAEACCLMEAACDPPEARFQMEAARCPVVSSYLLVPAYCMAAALPSLALAAYYAAACGHKALH
ncbi:hypothetical protein J15TS10_27110 [Paenibacillus woosongensis]|uniref:Uncharacterized protein n=1 Tax=Paenibacillus woosongensis TaxID=307580 RepID=A0ABQ4MSB9_9BACL|nr:hypothetical protein J15TS10_27110 [Paenibacillus woosongensis]